MNGKSNNRRKGSRKPGNRKAITGRKIEAKLEQEVGRELSTMRWKLWNSVPPPYPKSPTRSYKGAHYTTRVTWQNFNLGTGFTGQNLTAINTGPLFWSLGFELQDIAQLASYQALFDQYKLHKVHVRFQPRSNVVDVHSAGGTSQFPPRLFAVVDRDDITVPATTAAVIEYDNVQVVPSTTGISVSFVPSVTRSLYASGAFTGYEVVPGHDIWINLSNPAVPFYGLKGFIDALQGTSPDVYGWEVTVNAIISFKNTR